MHMGGGTGGGGVLPGTMTEWPGAVNETFTVTMLAEPRLPDDEPRGAMVTKWGLIGDPDPESTTALEAYETAVMADSLFGGGRRHPRMRF